MATNNTSKQPTCTGQMFIRAFGRIDEYDMEQLKKRDTKFIRKNSKFVCEDDDDLSISVMTNSFRLEHRLADGNYYAFSFEIIEAVPFQMGEADE